MKAAMDKKEKPVKKTVKKKSPEVIINKQQTQEMLEYA